MDNKSYFEEWEGLYKEDQDKRKREEYMLLNGILFLSFAVPALLAIIFALPMNFFYIMVSALVHEAGHGVWCLLGSRMLCSFSGFLTEMLATLVPALICFRERKIYLAGCVLLMCAGMSIQNNGMYMQSAEHPSGYGFMGLPLTVESHDWSVVFRKLGLIEHSYAIGKFTEELGRGIVIIFFTTSILGAVPMMYGWLPGKLTSFIGCGAIVAAIYFILSGASKIEIILALVLSIPLLKMALNNKVTKKEKGSEPESEIREPANVEEKGNIEDDKTPEK